MLGRTCGFLRDAWRHRRGRPGLPRILTYTVTFACNARCIMCDSWRLPPRRELALDELAAIFHQLPRMDAVRLTGGEPFLRKDLGDIVQLVEQRLRPLVVHVTSNGWLTDRLVTFCEDRRRRTPLQLLLSIDGMEEKHNQVRGSRTAWSRVMETIRALAARQKELRLRLAVNQTIVDPEGIEQYRQLRETLQPLGVQHRTVMAYEASATYHRDAGIDLAPVRPGDFATFGRFDAAQLDQFFGRAEKDLAEAGWGDRLAGRYYLRGIRNRLLHQRSVPNPPCAALGAHLRIFPDGDVPTCQFNSRVVGNLRRQSFAEVWHGSTAAAQRRWVRRCAGCWAECEVLPSAIYTLDIFRALLPERCQAACAQASAVPPLRLRNHLGHKAS
ncbi:MAG: radical SAM protein [Planctomycetes bacterium]|nr:radical SAM protein [Planctomycetota bacterium]